MTLSQFVTAWHYAVTSAGRLRYDWITVKEQSYVPRRMPYSTYTKLLAEA